MPLHILREEAKAEQVRQTGLKLNTQFRYGVGMYYFAVARNLVEPTALGTSSAGPCQIIVVHKAPGHGALGHFGGHPDPLVIAQAVQVMVQKLGGGPISDVVLAAGMVGSDDTQQNYETTILNSVRALYPDARVIWPEAPSGDDVWEACYYLPLAEKVGLLTESSGTFIGQGENGIAVHKYSDVM